MTTVPEYSESGNLGSCKALHGATGQPRASQEYLAAVEGLVIWRASVREQIVRARCGVPGARDALVSFCAILNGYRYRVIQARAALAAEPFQVRIAAFDAELSLLEASTDDKYLKVARSRRYDSLIIPFADMTMPDAERVRVSQPAAA